MTSGPFGGFQAKPQSGGGSGGGGFMFGNSWVPNQSNPSQQFQQSHFNFGIASFNPFPPQQPPPQPNPPAGQQQPPSQPTPPAGQQQPPPPRESALKNPIPPAATNGNPTWEDFKSMKTALMGEYENFKAAANQEKEAMQKQMQDLQSLALKKIKEKEQEATKINAEAEQWKASALQKLQEKEQEATKISAEAEEWKAKAAAQVEQLSEQAAKWKQVEEQKNHSLRKDYAARAQQLAGALTPGNKITNKRYRRADDDMGRDSVCDKDAIPSNISINSTLPQVEMQSCNSSQAAPPNMQNFYDPGAKKQPPE